MRNIVTIMERLSACIRGMGQSTSIRNILTMEDWGIRSQINRVYQRTGRVPDQRILSPSNSFHPRIPMVCRKPQRRWMKRDKICSDRNDQQDHLILISGSAHLQQVEVTRYPDCVRPIFEIHTCLRIVWRRVSSLAHHRTMCTMTHPRYSHQNKSMWEDINRLKWFNSEMDTEYHQQEKKVIHSEMIRSSHQDGLDKKEAVHVRLVRDHLHPRLVNMKQIWDRMNRQVLVRPI